MIHKVASRFNPKYKDDRCPICKYLNQNFIEVSDKELSCYSCGLMFLNKETRNAMKAVSFEMLKKQGEEKREYPCDCGFKAKSKAGLVAHQRKCEVNG